MSVHGAKKKGADAMHRAHSCEVDVGGLGVDIHLHFVDVIVLFRINIARLQ